MVTNVAFIMYDSAGHASIKACNYLPAIANMYAAQKSVLVSPGHATMCKYSQCGSADQPACCLWPLKSKHHTRMSTAVVMLSLHGASMVTR